MSHEPLRVAVVGLGRWSYTIAEAIQSSPLLRLVTCNNPHAEQAMQAAAHGKHIRVDKPVATTIADARSMISACEKAGVVLSVAAPYRFTRGMRFFRKMVDEGALGVLAMAEANYSNDRGYFNTP